MRAVCSLGDGSRIASGSYDKTVRVWDVATKECVATLKGAHELCDGGVQLGRRLAHRERQQRHYGARVGCGDKGVRGDAKGAHGAYVMAVCSLGDGSRIASGGSGDNTVRVWFP